MTTNRDVVYKGKFVELCVKNHWYEYVHVGTGQAVTVIGYKIKDDVLFILGRYEICPAHSDNMELCGLTGVVEEGEDPKQTAIRELEEESGIVSLSKPISLGTVKPSKASDTTAYLFAIDLSRTPDLPKYVGKGDGTRGERGAYCRWVAAGEALACKDATLIAGIARLQLYI